MASVTQMGGVGVRFSIRLMSPQRVSLELKNQSLNLCSVKLRRLQRERMQVIRIFMAGTHGTAGHDSWERPDAVGKWTEGSGKGLC